MPAHEGGFGAVCIHASAQFVAALGGKHLLSMLVNLLGRQFGVVGLIGFSLPAAEVRDGASSAGAELLELLVALGKSLAGDELEVRPSCVCSEADVVVCVGATKYGETPKARIFCGADGWRVYCSRFVPFPGGAVESPNPAGPYFAACLAAGAVFLSLVGSGDRVESSLTLWGFQEGQWDDLAQGPEPAGRLSTAYLIGLGAVGGACAVTLANTSTLSAELVGMDPQEFSETDRNRLITGVYDDVGTSKVRLVERLEGTLAFHGNVISWPNFLVSPSRKAPSDVLAEADLGRFLWVLSCVDRNVHRRAIARYLPRHALGGSTDGLVAQIAYYSNVGSCECLACNHPKPFVFNVEDLRETLLSLPRAERQAWYSERDADARTIAAIEEYLNAPECGTLGESELSRLGVSGKVDWAVGFVSVAAGVLLASAYQQALGRGTDCAFGEGSEIRFTFHSFRLLRSEARRRPDCDVCADSSVMESFARRWD